MKFDFLKFIQIPRQKNIKALLFHLAAIVILSIALLLLFFYAILPAATHSGETLTVPNLEGMHFDKLDEYLGNRGLRYEVVKDSAYSSVYDPLTVIKQYPEPNALVKEGRKIYITLKAKEPRKVEMPNLINKSLKYVELILKSKGLKRGSITYKPDLAQNAILEQWYNGEQIKPGTPISKGSSIDLVVGDGFGNRQFTLGNFVGRNIEDVEFAINGQGLSLGSVIIQVIDEDTYLDIDMIDLDSVQVDQLGMVIKQNPEAGTTVRLGDMVDLWIGAFSDEDSLMLLERNEIPVKDPEDFN